MGKLKDDSNFQIYGWMATKLKLKGNELLIYAIIYSFSRNDNGNGVFNASTAYLCEWTGLARKNVINCLSNLVSRNLIIKLEDNSLKRKPNIYGINKSILDNKTSYETLQALGTKSNKTSYETLQALGTKSNKTSYETLQALGTKSNKTSYETLHNNNIINTKDNTTINTNNNTIINSTISDEEKALGKVCEMYAKEITDKLYCSPHEVDEITKLADEHGIDNVEQAIKTAVEYNKKSLAYIRGILTGKNAKSKKHVELPDEYNIPF